MRRSGAPTSRLPGPVTSAISLPAHRASVQMPLRLISRAISLTGDVWMTARGDHAFIGDDAGAWPLHWSEGHWHFPARLPGAFRYAVPLPAATTRSLTPSGQ